MSLAVVGSVTIQIIMNLKQSDMAKTFEQECAEGRFEFNPNRSFDERCDIVRQTTITKEMTYEERLAMLKARFGL